MSPTVAGVIHCLEEVFKNKGLERPLLTPESELSSALGLDSLDYAELVTRLQIEFGIDPFASGTVHEIRTLADLASLYENGSR